MITKIIMTMMVLLTVILTGCSDADVASRNLSTAAEMFELDRRIVFYNGITGDYVLAITGKCSVKTQNRKLAVTCKTNTGFKKHYLGLSDNVTYFSEQLEPSSVSVNRYKVIFKPSIIVPDIRVK